ncbi:MAG: DUF423 domain-containing protein [Ignavibacteria bacterium]|nr:DUF423 domain-containing protein [Ignavibacteria bacterium]
MTITHDRFRQFVALAGITGGLAVVLGAFGAHGLKEHLTPEMLSVFETAVRYQVYHALAMFAVALLADRTSAHSTRRLFHASGWSFFVGIVIFCGSLYALSLTGQKWVGAITPLGGVALIAGWIFLIWASIRPEKDT